jgi:thiamine-monophosphate kinase
MMGRNCKQLATEWAVKQSFSQVFSAFRGRGLDRGDGRIGLSHDSFVVSLIGYAFAFANLAVRCLAMRFPVWRESANLSQRQRAPFHQGKVVEQSFVAWAKMRARRLPQVRLGIGDDAAILAADGNDTVITSDSLLDGVHFDLLHADARRIGRKLVNVNLSDLAAMAAQPVAIFLSLCLPLDSSFDTEVLAAEIYEGVCDAAEKFGVALAGGDTNCWSGPLALHLTAVGHTVDGTVWTRAGAQPDDLVVVTGELGGSLLGKHLDFEPRIDLANRIRPQIDVHAAMDISDGLSIDLLRMCDASSCGAILELERVPVSEAARLLSATSGKTPPEHALGDGEDFELLLALPPNQLSKLQALVGAENAIPCGTFSSRTGLWAKEGARIRQLTSSGYVHGR